MPDSSSPAGVSFRRATRFVQVACWCAGIFIASDTPDLRVSEDDTLDFVLRKLAHLAVFAVLAILVARATRPRAAHAASTLVLAWCATLAWATSDEWHQTFVEGRVGHASDVGIDMLGATAALGAWRLWCTRRSSGGGAAPA